MNLKKEYQKLYDQWLQEFEYPELTPLNEDSFNLYKILIESFNNVMVNKEISLESDLLDAYKKNIKFLFDDLLKVRELKLINSALTLKEVDLKNLIEAERLLYQNLVATIKGYKKIKTLSIESGKEQLIKEIAIKPIQNESEILINNGALTNLPEVESVSELDKELVKNSFTKEEDFQYTLIRFIKNTPALVGVDLKTYGPFEKNDIANIPSKNASILLNENYAEKIDIV